MPSKQWKVKIDDSNYTIKIEHGSMVRRFAVQVDGKQVNLLENVLIDRGNRLAFKINDHIRLLFNNLIGTPKIYIIKIIVCFNFDIIII